MSNTCHSLNDHVAALLSRHGYGCAGAHEGLLLAGGGSGRAFVRVQTVQGPVVVMTAPQPRADFRSWLEVHRLLEANQLPVPRLLAAEPDEQVVIMEDLGDDSLERVVRRTADPAARQRIYAQALELLRRLQALPIAQIRQCAYLQHRTFGYEALRWETDYFVECCLHQLCGLCVAEQPQLETELHQLALTLAAEPRVFMHRDFQSRNIHLTDGQVRIIDFQTATRGLCQYDLASLARDPYVPLALAERHQLIALYRECCGLPAAAADEFERIYHLACLQRSMQALGAFAFLGLRRQQPSFLASVAPGLALLSDTLARVEGFGRLREVVDEATAAYAQRQD